VDPFFKLELCMELTSIRKHDVKHTVFKVLHNCWCEHIYCLIVGNAIHNAMLQYDVTFGVFWNINCCLRYRSHPLATDRPNHKLAGICLMVRGCLPFSVFNLWNWTLGLWLCVQSCQHCNKLSVSSTNGWAACPCLCSLYFAYTLVLPFCPCDYTKPCFIWNCY
jgi:hypothetical protein